MKDIYSNTWYVYDSFSIMSLASVKQGESISPILFNLSSEHIIRSIKKFNGINLFGSKGDYHIKKVITTCAAA